MAARLTYKAAGVDIELKEKLVPKFRQLARRTLGTDVLGGVGGFGAMVGLNGAAKMRAPVLVSGADGVGTKLKIAFATGRHDTIGIDCVAMCINDIICHNARPLFFLDYIGCGKLDPKTALAIVEGVARGCALAGASLVGGETAQMPGIYKNGEYDLAGFAVGIAERSRIPLPKTIRAGDILIGLASNGLHSNGFALARKVLLERARLKLDALSYLSFNARWPTRCSGRREIYAKLAAELFDRFAIKGLANITGGGIPENLPRVMPPNLACEIRRGSWPTPPIFQLIAKLGKVEQSEMDRTFNNGIGMIAVALPDRADEIVKYLKRRKRPAYVIGMVVRGERGVRFAMNDARPPVKLGVLISGEGTNLQAIIDAVERNELSADLRVVISNKPSARGLERARRHGIETIVIEHRGFPSREAFDTRLVAKLNSREVELVACAGFMRLLSPVMVRAFPNRIMNIHPALCPAFPGIDAQQAALDYGARFTGCTVFFVSEGIDDGPVIIQAVVPIYPDDDEPTLSGRIHTEEHRIYPYAIRLYQEGRLEVRGRRVIIKDFPLTHAASMINPRL